MAMNFIKCKMKNKRSIIFTLVRALSKKSFTISFVESATCGMLARMINTVPKTSDVFLGSIICYHESVKTSLLKIKPSLIKKHTAESQQVTDALVKKLRLLIPADIMVSVTGITTDDGSGKTPGTMFITIKAGRRLHRFKKVFKGSSEVIKKQCCYFIFSSITGIIQS